MNITINIPDTLVEKVIADLMNNFPEASSGSSLVCSHWNYKKLTFQFVDEEDNKVHTVDKDKLLKAFPLLFTDKWPKGGTQPPMSDNAEVWDNWLCQSDATDFDAFIQLAIFGEVIYG